jgi:hypothetical protein
MVQFSARCLLATGASSKIVMRGELVTFHELVARVRTLKVDCIQGEIIDLTSICDKQCYKCLINTYAVLKYEILIPVLFENRICGVKCSWWKNSWRSPWRFGEGMLDFLLAQILFDIYLQV